MAVIQAGVMLSSGHMFEEPLQIWSWQQNMCCPFHSPNWEHKTLHRMLFCTYWLEIFCDNRQTYHSYSPNCIDIRRHHCSPLEKVLKKNKRGTKHVYQNMLGVSLLRRRSSQSQANLLPQERSLKPAFHSACPVLGNRMCPSYRGELMGTYSNRTGVTLSFLHEVVFFIDRRSCLFRTVGRFRKNIFNNISYI